MLRRVFSTKSDAAKKNKRPSKDKSAGSRERRYHSLDDYVDKFAVTSTWFVSTIGNKRASLELKTQNVGSFLIIPNVDQPTAVFELCLVVQRGKVVTIPIQLRKHKLGLEGSPSRAWFSNLTELVLYHSSNAHPLLQGTLLAPSSEWLSRAQGQPAIGDDRPTSTAPVKYGTVDKKQSKGSLEVPQPSNAEDRRSTAYMQMGKEEKKLTALQQERMRLSSKISTKEEEMLALDRCERAQKDNKKRSGRNTSLHKGNSKPRKASRHRGRSRSSCSSKISLEVIAAGAEYRSSSVSSGSSMVQEDTIGEGSANASSYLNVNLSAADKQKLLLAKEAEGGLIDRLAANSPWYCVAESRSSSIKALRKGGLGNFVIRATKEPGMFAALSVMVEGGEFHTHIQVQDDQIFLVRSSERFNSLTQLVTYYRSTTQADLPHRLVVHW